MILQGSMNKCNAGTEMHVFMLEIVWFYWVLWTNVVLELKCMCSCLKLCDYVAFYEQMKCLNWNACVLARNCVVCSESALAAESVLSTAKQRSLLKLYVYSKLVLPIEIVLSAVNQRSLLNVCCLQQTSVRCRKCVVYSELAFITDFLLSAAN
jgi:hypothetical protein